MLPEVERITVSMIIKHIQLMNDDLRVIRTEIATDKYRSLKLFIL